MTPDRRTFLRALLALPIAATFDVEKLLWVPKAMITVPAMPRAPLSWDEITRITLREINPEKILRGYMEATNLFYDALDKVPRENIAFPLDIP